MMMYFIAYYYRIPVYYRITLYLDSSTFDKMYFGLNVAISCDGVSAVLFATLFMVPLRGRRLRKRVVEHAQQEARTG